MNGAGGPARRYGVDLATALVVVIRSPAASLLPSRPERHMPLCRRRLWTDRCVSSAPGGAMWSQGRAGGFPVILSAAKDLLPRALPLPPADNAVCRTIGTVPDRKALAPAE